MMLLAMLQDSEDIEDETREKVDTVSNRGRSYSEEELENIMAQFVSSSLGDRNENEFMQVRSIKPPCTGGQCVSERRQEFVMAIARSYTCRFYLAQGVASFKSC